MPDWTKEQKQAIEKDNTNIIVSAGAGSGKTAVLSERVIRKLKQGVRVNELLILTFTKAAAKEMKERIRKKIKKEPSLTKELDLIDSAYITTFDSFALSVVKKYHYLLNVSPNISVADESLIRLEKERIIDKIFEEKYLENDKDFEKLIGDFCIKDDKDIRKYILSINDKLDLKSNKREYLEKYLENAFKDEKIENDIALFEQLLINKIEDIKLTLQELYYLADQDYYNSINDVVSPLFEAKTYNEIIYKINISLPKLPRGSSDELKKVKNSLKELIDDVYLLCTYKDKEEIMAEILSTYDYVKCIIDIILKLDEKLFEFKFKNDIYEFNDIAILAINVVRDNEDVREELKNTYNEIMIDEYQDTSDLQEEFISLISNNNVYMVGDIKQSIYRFRNANPYIFKNKYDAYSKGIGGIKIDLNKNFRSRKEVISNINIMFNIVMDNIIGGAEYQDSHQMVFGNVSYDEKGNTKENSDLQIYGYNYDSNLQFDKEEIEAFIVANDIKNKVENKYKIYDKDEEIIREAKYSDFVIIMDRSSSFALYKQIFEYLNIPLTIYKDEKITEDIILTILKNTLMLIKKIHDDEIDSDFKYLFLSVGRGPLFELSDQELFNYFKNDNFKESNLYIKLKELSGNMDNYSTKNFIRKVIYDLDFYNNLIKIGNINSNIIKLDYILNMIDSFSNLGYTITDFINYLDEIINKDYDMKFSVDKETNDSVRIMTIHKSKGLEYHICYYTGLYSKFNISDLNDRFLYDNKYGIITPVFNEGITHTIYKDLLREDYIKEEISEKIRLFYVALTRAKEKMILVLPVQDANESKMKENGVLIDSCRIKYRSFKDIILSIKNILDKNILNIDLNNIIISKDYNKIKETNYINSINKTNKKINISEINIESEEIIEKSFSKKQKELISKKIKDNIDFGLEMHSLFEIIDFKNPNLDDYDISDFNKNKIKKLLDNKIFENIKNAEIYKEYEFMYEEDNITYHGIIDLMLVYDDHIDIIDYKLKNVIDENYTNQLNGYKKYIENKTNKKVNTYLYSIIDEVIYDVI